MKGSKILVTSFLFLLSFQFMNFTVSVIACKPPETPIEDPKIEDIINDIGSLIEKIIYSTDESWKNPGENRKEVIICKLYVIINQLTRENLCGAYDKMTNDIKPKLIGTWVIDTSLQEIFSIDCDKIISKIDAIINPEPYVDDDTEAPEIILTPSMSIADGDAIGGILIEWQITDFSGIAEAIVQADSVIIASYGPCDSISDSYLLPNTLGTTTIIVNARDNDNDPEHPNGVDWLENSAQSTITVYDDDTSVPTISIEYTGDGDTNNPGHWTVIVEDLESGLSEIKILVDGVEILHDDQLNGILSTSTEIPVPAIEGVHTIEVNAKNNDNDWIGDISLNSESVSQEIVKKSVGPPIIIGGGLGMAAIAIGTIGVVKKKVKK
ncbi:MAG: hypothetical protein P8Y70_18925 [Candidatus Lokiarchaeota archaeon]